MTVYTNAAMIAAELTGSGMRAASRAAAITRHHGMLLETRIKANASGRPGPRAVTGDYRRSWSTTYRFGAAAVSAIVGTNKPQARRLEYGFVGVDALGRHYNQPPYPHVGPAVATTEPEYLDDLGEVLTLGGGT